MYVLIKWNDKIYDLSSDAETDREVAPFWCHGM